jgi:hypothetical protein
MRRGRLIAGDRTELEQRLAPYFDPRVPWEEIVASRSGPVEPAGRFDPPRARQRVLAAPDRGAPSVRRYALLPFDNRWCYWTATRPLWNEPRPELVGWIDGRTRVFVGRMNAERPNENAPAIVTRALPDYHLLRPNVVAMPMHLHGAGTVARDLLNAAQEGRTRANLSSTIRSYLATLQLPDPDKDIAIGELVWLHALAICYSPNISARTRMASKATFPVSPCRQPPRPYKAPHGSAGALPIYSTPTKTSLA